MQHHLGLEVTAKNLSTKIAANVGSEKMVIVRVLPLFVKNLVMKAVYKVVGEKYSCLAMSNLGLVTLPPEMASYVRRLDFILGPQSQAPHNCGIITWGDDLYINLIRNTREPELEACFCRVLKELDLEITVQSNDPKGV